MSAIYLSVRGENMDANQIQNLFASNVRQLLVDADLDYDKLYEFSTIPRTGTFIISAML